jgi:NADH dehydrogenase [ubiquinone] 1 alpha subcomplex assembly factor 7
MTPLETRIRELIMAEGPMPLDSYMSICLGHPTLGYYMTRDPLGQAGDFTTAPEMSQVFGELIGIWVAQAWQLMGSPGDFSLIELGPGRGTLMKDLMRATVKVPGLHTATDIQLVETSPTLKQLQQRTILELQAGKERPTRVEWHLTTATLPSKPSIIIANEFFDAIPIRQFELRDGALFERCVAIENDRLGYSLKPTGQSHPNKESRVYEMAPARASIAKDLGSLIAINGGAALVIDYGHRKSANGDTLQAMMNHSYSSIFECPGEADITSHVDFEQLLNAFGQGGAKPQPLLTQGEFLNAMGLSLRTEALARSLDSAAHDMFIKASHRLADDTEMGQLFKVAAITHPALPVPYPFGSI